MTEASQIALEQTLEDLTPPDFQILPPSLGDQIKKWGRKILYPPLNLLQNLYFKRMVPDSLKVDNVLFGQRGNDYERNRSKLNHLFPIEGKKLLIGGCGTGRDVLSWLAHRPAEIWCVDFFNYSKAWKQLEALVATQYPSYKGKLHFAQANLTNLQLFEDNTFDLFACDAVFEHCQDLNQVLCEIARILTSNGRIYACYGPLYFSWGGDHFSGIMNVLDGYNHLLLNSEEYENYLELLPITSFHDPMDGRTFIKKKLFSYLKVNEYLRCFDEIGNLELLDVMISPEALQFKKREPKRWDELLRISELSEFDLICSTMTIVLNNSRKNLKRSLSG